MGPVPAEGKPPRRDEAARTACGELGTQRYRGQGRPGRLRTCGRDSGDGYHLLGHALNPDVDPDDARENGPPTRVPSMNDRRIISVAARYLHGLALSAEGEVFSWGKGQAGALGHADRGARAEPSRIESLSRIESIATGAFRSAAVNEVGRLFTWRAARFIDSITGDYRGPSGLGYEMDHSIDCQLTPRRVDALAQDRVVGVALGDRFTLATTDAGGAVFSFGYSEVGTLGNGSLAQSEVLPRRIEALA